MGVDVGDEADTRLGRGVGGQIWGGPWLSTELGEQIWGEAELCP